MAAPAESHEKVLLTHVHARKSGGTSLRSALRKLTEKAPEEPSFRFVRCRTYEGEAINPISLKAEMKRVQNTTGGGKDSDSELNRFFVTSLRDPIDRAVALYLFQFRFGECLYYI